jgi:hypothetical protein
MYLRRALLILFAICVLYPIQPRQSQFVSLKKAIEIKSNKNSPPHVAFSSIISEFAHDRVNKNFPQNEKLEAGDQLNEIVLSSNQREILPEMSFSTNDKDYNNEYAWVNELSEEQTKRIQSAENDDLIYSSEWSKNDFKIAAETAVQEVENQLQNQNSKIIFDGSIPQSQVQVQNRTLTTTQLHTIEGKLLVQGIGLIPGYQLELLHNNEGVFQSGGRIDLESSTYHYNLNDPQGELIVRMLDEKGRAVGQGNVQLAQMKWDKRFISGPTIVVKPNGRFPTSVASYYHGKKPNRAKVSLFNQDRIINEGKEESPSMTKGSQTIARATADGHMTTTQILMAGLDQDSTTVFPNSWVEALVDIISQQQKMNSKAEINNLIWGRVTVDGKPAAGVRVVLESDPSAEAIYFNGTDMISLPDVGLKTTGSNGYYVFINATPDFHAIVAERANQIIGYQNAIVENGNLTIGNIDGTTGSHMMSVKTYDAFYGLPIDSEIEMQHLEEKIQTNKGVSAVIAKNREQIGNAICSPIAPGFLTATYQYYEMNDYAHFPLIRQSWLENMIQYARLNIYPNTGIVVGFTPLNEFDLFISGDGNDQAEKIYFDSQGKQINQPVSGGGFILVNIEPGSQEIVLVEKNTDQVTSKVISVDPQSVNVLLF